MGMIDIGGKIVEEATGLVKKTFDNLVVSKKITEAESSSIFDNIKKNLFDKSTDFENSFKELLKKFYDKMDFATPEEMEALRRRIKILEKLTQQQNKNL